MLTTDDQRLAANSLSWSTGRLVQILASAVVGGFMAVLGTGPAFALNATTFVFSAVMIASLRVQAHAGHLGAASKRGLTSYFADARAGLAPSVRPPRAFTEGTSSVARWASLLRSSLSGSGGW